MSQHNPIENVNVETIAPLITPAELKKELPLSEKAQTVVARARKTIRNILTNEDSRLLVIVGPCSIHDKKAALEYADRLLDLQHRCPHLFLVMRTYFEKPRTTIGWKGLINDPNLDNSFDIERGLRLAREILLEINEKGMACATEFLDPLVVTYVDNLVAWGAVGARTTESQIHRQMVSALSMPIGFKNGTGGSIDIAANAMSSAQAPHRFISQNDDGRTSWVQGKGNACTHLVLRGGNGGPNFEPDSIRSAKAILTEEGLIPRIMVDCSHANSDKKYENQSHVLQRVVQQRREGEHAIIGIMLESHLVSGKQSISDAPLKYGVSVTDACLGWEETEKLLLEANGKPAT